MALSSTNLTLYYLPFLSISLASSHPTYESFLHCLSLHSPPSTNFSQLIYFLNTASYSSLLLSSIHNLRWPRPTWPTAEVETPVATKEDAAAKVARKWYESLLMVRAKKVKGREDRSKGRREREEEREEDGKEDGDREGKEEDGCGGNGGGDQGSLAGVCIAFLERRVEEGDGG